MPQFEVLIPAKDADSLTVTLTVEAPNWLGALKTGLRNIGETQAISNVMCDIKEDSSIHVTDPASGRVFRLMEVKPGAAKAPPPPAAAPAPAAAPPPPAPAPAPPPAAAAPPPPAPPPPAPPPPAPAPAPAAAAPAPAAQAAPAPKPAPAPAPAAKPTAPTRAPDVAAARKVTGQFESAPAPVERKTTREKVAEPIGRAATKPAAVAFKVEDVLAEIFEKMQDLYGEVDKAKIAGTLLDVAMHYIHSDAGTFYTSDLSGGDLEFTAVRGPKAGDIKKGGFKVPVGTGIVGFCAQEGVSLAISDVKNDARFMATISERIGYECRNMVCAPLYRDGRLWGAIQLINRKGGDSFAAQEVDVLNYLAHEGATLLAAAEGA